MVTYFRTPKMSSLPTKITATLVIGGVRQEKTFTGHWEMSQDNDHYHRFILDNYFVFGVDDYVLREADDLMLGDFVSEDELPESHRGFNSDVEEMTLHGFYSKEIVDVLKAEEAY